MLWTIQGRAKIKLAVIPARGGSKRIPRKNIKEFCGKPLIAYSIEACLKAKIFDLVIVSTDDAEIANVSKKYGAKVPFFRPDNLADDYTVTNEVVKHAISWLRNKGQTVTYACCVYATAPFIRAIDLLAGWEKIEASEYDFVFTVTSFPFPIQRAVRINKFGLVEALNKKYNLVRSQDLEECYHDAGQFYWGPAESFDKGKEIFSSNSCPVFLKRYLVQDIDTAEDWETAELMYRALKMSE